MGWKADLNVDSRVCGLLKGLLVARDGTSDPACTLVLLTVTQDGVKWTTCHPPHSFTAHLFLPRSVFNSFDLSATLDSPLLCVSLTAMLGALLAEASKAGVGCKLEWDCGFDFVSLNYRGCDGARVSCKLATFEPFPVMEAWVSHNADDAYQMILNADQYRGMFGGAELRKCDRLKLQIGDAMVRFAVDFQNGAELNCTFSGTQSWTFLQCSVPPVDATYRTSVFVVIGAAAAICDKIVLRSRMCDRLCRVQLLCPLNSTEPAFLYYTFPALVD